MRDWAPELMTMHACNPADWTAFSAAVTGAAALAGLLFVAVSINLVEIVR